MEKIIGSAIFSLFNNLVQVKVVDEGRGPTLVIGSATYDNMLFSFKVHTDVSSLKKLGEMLIKASNASYSESGDSVLRASILGGSD
jgi:hypothetical protein